MLDTLRFSAAEVALESFVRDWVHADAAYRTDNGAHLAAHTRIRRDDCRPSVGILRDGVYGAYLHAQGVAALLTDHWDEVVELSPLLVSYDPYP